MKHNAKDASSLARVVLNDGRKLVLDDIKDLWARSAIEIWGHPYRCWHIINIGCRITRNRGRFGVWIRRGCDGPKLSVRLNDTQIEPH